MLKYLCETVEKTGELRQAIRNIDFGQIYSDPEQVAQAHMRMMERAGELATLQHDLLDLMREV